MTTVLFVCVKNAGRSVMAETFFNAAAGGRARAVSAGTIPAERPHPETIHAMREAGFDVSGHRGRLLTDEMIRSADRVVTMGCGVDEAACPSIRLASAEDWNLPDPSGAAESAAAQIRDEIKRRVDALILELGV